MYLLRTNLIRQEPFDKLEVCYIFDDNELNRVLQQSAKQLFLSFYFIDIVENLDRNFANSAEYCQLDFHFFKSITQALSVIQKVSNACKQAKRIKIVFSQKSILSNSEKMEVEQAVSVILEGRQFSVEFYGATKQKIVIDPDDPNEIELRVYGKHKNQTNGCILPKLDPWDVSILLRMSKPKQTKVNKCKPTLEKLTELKNGILRVVDSNSNQNATECSYRCLYAVNDYEIKTGNWARVDNVNGSVPGCDLVEVGCKHHSNYSFIHTQIVESQFNVTTKSDSAKQPDVYWVILDSVSTSMFKRAFPKTERVLMNKFKAIEFPYLNKVELNSRPNAYAMFFGERYKYDWCKTPLDDKNFIGFDFQKAGYVTQQTEDWALGAINWSNCIGFKKKQVDHFMRPFWLKLDMGSKKYNSKLSWRMLNRSCREEHHYLFEQALQFANAYKTRPKFSFTWIVQLAHNFNSVLFKEDERFAEFFKKLHKKSKNAFVFFQSDHGIRFGKIRSIPTIGNIEDNNPFLFVSVPERLRKNKKLIKQIKMERSPPSFAVRCARDDVANFTVRTQMEQTH
ncbi:hypothetical protein M3Y97_01096300 [Aphelenchoides bicaudatus]|nr:hypothetical protein M3Y97_01096300 [Aphelenchoides bicaudatus]